MIEAILNGISTESYLGYLFYMLMGVFISYASQQYDSFKLIKQYGGFKVSTLVKENWKRATLVIIGIHLAIVFQEKFGSSEPSNWSALTLGLTLDVVIDRIVNRKK